MKMIEIPFPTHSLLPEGECLNLFKQDSYTEKMFISSKHFKEIEVMGYGHDDKIRSYKVTVYFNEGSGLTQGADDKITYRFPDSPLGIETAHQLVDSIMTQINGSQ